MAAASQSFEFRQWWNREREFHPNTTNSSCLDRLVRVFLFLAGLVFVLELIAGLTTSWNFSVYAQWLHVRAEYISPPVQVLADVCFVVFLLQWVDRTVVLARSVSMNVAMEAGRRKEDVEQGKGGREESSMVVIQIPAKVLSDHSIYFFFVVVLNSLYFEFLM